MPDAPSTFEIAAEVRRAVEHCCSFDVAYLDGDHGSPMLLTDYETGTVWRLTVEPVAIAERIIGDA